MCKRKNVRLKVQKTDSAPHSMNVCVCVFMCVLFREIVEIQVFLGLLDHQVRR